MKSAGPIFDRGETKRDSLMRKRSGRKSVAFID